MDNMAKMNPPELMDELLEKFKPSSDIIFKPLQIEGNKVYIFYLKSVIDGAKLQGMLIKPFFEMKSIVNFTSYIESLPDLLDMTFGEELQIEITKGSVLVAIEDEFYLIDLKLVNTNAVQQTIMEPTVHGPQLALSEDMETNLNIIRQRYHEPTLKFEIHQLKDKTHQPLAIIYA